MTTTEPAPRARNLDWWPAAWVALGTGLTWVVVVLYRALGRGIGEKFPTRSSPAPASVLALRWAG